MSHNKHGRLDCLQYLHENGCPWNAVNIIRKCNYSIIALYVLLETVGLKKRNLRLKNMMNHRVKYRPVLKELSYVPAGYASAFPGGKHYRKGQKRWNEMKEKLEHSA